MLTYLFLAAALATSPADVQVSTLDGQTAHGGLVELSADHVTLRTAGGDRSYKPGELLAIVSKQDGERPKEKPAAWIELVDGSRLAAMNFQVTKGTAKIGLVGGQAVELPTRAIRLVRFSPAEAAPAWTADLKSDAAGDLIVVRKRDDVDFIEGAAGDISADVVHFTVDRESIAIKRTKVEGLVYIHPAGDNPPAPSCALECFDGTRVKGKSVTLAGQQVRVVGLFGATMTFPLSTIRQIELSVDKVVYLGDLQPESSQWTALLGSDKPVASLVDFYRPLVNRGREGGPLRLAGTKYSKGLSLYSRTLLTYKLPAKSRWFKAVAGIDDAVRDQGNVELVIRGDDKILFSGRLTGRDPPRDLDLNLADVKRLDIVVDYGDDLDVGDYLDLCDARIVK